MGRRILRLHFRTYPEDLWVGECIELDVASGGETEAQARKRVEEATRLFISTIAGHGDLDRVLAEKGVRVTQEGEPPVGHIEEWLMPLPLGSA